MYTNTRSLKWDYNGFGDKKYPVFHELMVWNAQVKPINTKKNFFEKK